MKRIRDNLVISALLLIMAPLAIVVVPLVLFGPPALFVFVVTALLEPLIGPLDPHGVGVLGLVAVFLYWGWMLARGID